jgi:hypothetical protein
MWLGFRQRRRRPELPTHSNGIDRRRLGAGVLWQPQGLRERPPAADADHVTAAITPDRITVSPKDFGAGPVTIIIANQTEQPQTVTVETETLAEGPGIKQSTSPINPDGTATLKLDLKEGDYTVTVDGDGIEGADVAVGKPRPSSQDQLLQP